jgi:hypothetical protein
VSVLDSLTDDGLKALLDVRAAVLALRAARDESEADEARADLDDALNRADEAGVQS